MTSISGRVATQRDCRGCEFEGLSGADPSGCKYAAIAQCYAAEFTRAGTYRPPGLLGRLLNGVIGMISGVFSAIVNQDIDQTLR